MTHYDTFGALICHSVCTCTLWNIITFLPALVISCCFLQNNTSDGIALENAILVPSY